MTHLQTAALSRFLNPVHLVKSLFFHSSFLVALRNVSSTPLHPPLSCIPHPYFLPSFSPNGFSPSPPLDHPPLAPVCLLQLSLFCTLSLLILSLPLAPTPPVPPSPSCAYSSSFPVTYGLQVLPGVRDGEAAPLPDALVDHQLSEKSWGASGRQLGRSGVAPPCSQTWDFGRLQLQVHVLLERSDAGVHLHTQLIGRHPCSLRIFASLVQTQSHQTAGVKKKLYIDVKKPAQSHLWIVLPLHFLFSLFTG